MTLDELKKRVRAYHPQGDVRLLEEAYDFSRRAHLGQFRVSGEAYIEHPLAVAYILADLELDLTTVAAGLLHDVVEDTNTPILALEERFGQEMALLVDGVTKLSRLEYRTREEEQVENLRKMFLAMARDIRVVLIKLADRLHNMRTLKHLIPDKRKEVAEETLEIYAPLAHRLGIWRIKWELEDLAFRHQAPDRYAELVDKVARKRLEREEFIRRVIDIMKQKLAEVGIEADIQGRAKHFYSIYKKMTVQGKDFSEIYDLMAVRVIVNTVKDCYGVLGIIHSLWKPIPGRFKDFVAVPKSNMYQSLHTTVIGPEGEPFEIQIRTWEMHRTAEYGIAAHWKYKEGGRGDRDFEQKLSWLRQILEWQHDQRDAREFMESLKIDVFSDEVFVFTPKGDVIDLPAGSTPIDFAYKIHTDVGHRCVGAKVNNKIVPLDYQLANGDIVEILTSKTAAGPRSDWLKIVKTSDAKSKIRSWFRKEKREENLARGRDLVEKEIRRQGFEVHELMTVERLDEVARKLGYNSGEDLLVSVGYAGVTSQQVVSRLREEYRREKKPRNEGGVLPAREARAWEGYGRAVDGVRVKGIDHVLVRFSRCCNPVPGDPIVGYITRGRGVSIHRLTCPNMKQLAASTERFIEVAWDKVTAAFYPVEIAVRSIDRPGVLSEVANVIAETRTNIISARATTYKDKTALIDLVLEIKDLDQLRFIMQRLEKVRDVVSVDRVVREKAR